MHRLAIRVEARDEYNATVEGTLRFQPTQRTAFDWFERWGSDDQSERRGESDRSATVAGLIRIPYHSDFFD